MYTHTFQSFQLIIRLFFYLLIKNFHFYFVLRFLRNLRDNNVLLFYDCINNFFNCLNENDYFLFVLGISVRKNRRASTSHGRHHPESLKKLSRIQKKIIYCLQKSTKKWNHRRRAPIRPKIPQWICKYIIIKKTRDKKKKYHTSIKKFLKKL